MFVRKLVLANLITRPARVGLTVAAVALSVSMVVAVTSGYASVIQAVEKYVDRYVGSVDAQVSRRGDPRGSIEQSLLAALRADPAVARAVGRIEISDPLIDKNGEGVDGRTVDVIGVARPGDHRVDVMTMEQGQFFNASTGNVAVIDQALAERIHEGVGDEVWLPKPESKDRLKLRIVGIVHKPEIMAAAIQTMYVPLDTLQKFLGMDRAGPDQPAGSGPRLSIITLEFNKGVDAAAFKKRMEPELRRLDPTAQLQLTRDSRATLDKELTAIDLLSYLGGAVSMLSATFIIFSSLAMGVTERQRSLAMLRAVGAFRGQIARLVVVEGMLLAIAGAVVGAPLGWIWVKALSLMFRDIFSDGVVLSWGGVAFGSIGSVLTALAASLLPAWWATRVDPLEAMTPQAKAPSHWGPLGAALAGALLVSIDPFLFFGPLESGLRVLGVSDPARVAQWMQFYGHFLLGLPGIMIGFFLLAPALIIGVERGAGPIIARLFGLNPRLVRQQLSNGLWRAAGTSAALMVGLAVLIVMEVQGDTALKGWKLPTHFPDIFIVSTIGDVLKRGGLDVDQIKTLKQIPGVQDHEIMPIAIASPQFASQMFSFALAAMNPDATMFLGIDPKLAFKLMELDFRQGDQADAQRVLTAGKDVALTDGKTLKGTVAFSGDQLVVTDVWGKPHAVPLSLVSRVHDGGYQTLHLKDGSTVAGDVTLDPASGAVSGVASTEPATGPSTAPAATRPAEARKPGGWLSEINPLNLFRGGAATRPAEVVYDVEPLDDNSKLIRVRAADLARPVADGYDITHGRFLIVTNEFRQLKHLGVGDLFPLKNTLGQTVDYTICGVVWSPGIDVMVSVFDMRGQFNQRTAASVFGTVEDARRDFGTEHIYLFAANLKPGVEREQIMKEIKTHLRVEGMKAGDVRHIKDMIQKTSYRLLHLAGIVAYAAMAVASLGVTNTVMAAVRTRRWQFGVLRAVGSTRGQLLRLVLSEAIMLGIVASAMGVAAGAVMAKDAYQLSLLLTGYDPGISIPWGVIGIGVGIVMAIAFLASLWPAMSVARAEPLELLSAGRAAA